MNHTDHSAGIGNPIPESIRPHGLGDKRFNAPLTASKKETVVGQVSHTVHEDKEIGSAVTIQIAL